MWLQTPHGLESSRLPRWVLKVWFPSPWTKSQTSQKLVHFVFSFLQTDSTPSPVYMHYLPGLHTFSLPTYLLQKQFQIIVFNSNIMFLDKLQVKSTDEQLKPKALPNSSLKTTHKTNQPTPARPSLFCSLATATGYFASDRIWPMPTWNVSARRVRSWPTCQRVMLSRRHSEDATKKHVQESWHFGSDFSFLVLWTAQQ